MRKKLTLFSFLVLFLMLGAGCSDTSSTATNAMTTYENKANGFTINYPKNWEVKEGAYGTVAAFTSPQESETDFVENVAVTVSETTATVDEYVEAALQNAAEGLMDFKLVNDTTITLAGESGRIITYTFKQRTLLPYTRDVFVVKNGKVYDITFTASQAEPLKYWDMAQKMIESFTSIE